MTSKKPRASVDLAATAAIGKAVGGLSRPLKGPKKPKDAKKPKQEKDVKSPEKSKTPSAKNVRDGLKSGHIKPAEAAGLNPRGGLVPKSKDVKTALSSGKISYDEAKSLNSNAFKKKQ